MPLLQDLEGCQHTLIGDEMFHMKGISGGQRRRVSGKPCTAQLVCEVSWSCYFGVCNQLDISGHAHLTARPSNQLLDLLQLELSW